MFLSNRCIFKSVVFAFMAQPPHTRVHGGHLVEARGVDSRLRARSGAALTVPRTVIHFRPVRLPQIKNHRTRKVHGGHLVEARGVEPLSEDGLIGLSPGADDC